MQSEQAAAPAPDPPGCPFGPPEGATSRPRRGYWIPAFIAMAVLLVIGVLVGAGDLDHRAPNSLTGSDVASELSLGIQAQQHSSAPPTLRCPAREPIHAGLRFTCTEIGAGKSQTIEVTEIDDRGRLSWSISTPSGL